jgi:hypothetical protein
MKMNFLQRWRKVGDRWQNLHGFFQVSGARFFIAWFALTPAVSKIIEQLPEPLIIMSSQTPISISLTLPFNWMVLWFASFSYALAFVLFHLRCPQFIRKYPNFTEYEKHGHSPRWLVAEAEMAWHELSPMPKINFAKRLSDKGFAKKISDTSNFDTSRDATKSTILEEHTEWKFLYNEDWFQLAVNASLDISKVKDLFWEIFGRHSEDRAKTRYFVWGLSTIACVLTFYVVAENILFVLKHLYN